MNKYSETSHKQVTSTRVRSVFLAIFLLAIFAGLIVWPSAPGWFGKFKVHLGLDLQGGTHLVYQADVSALEGLEKRDGVEALRDVIERRVNAYGVSEPVVQTNFSGDNYRIIVELAGIKDANEAIAIIDKTPHLEFKTQGEAKLSEQNVTEAQNEIKANAQKVLDRALLGEDFSTLAKEYSEDPGSAINGGDLGYVTKGLFVPEFDKAIFEDLKDGQISKELIESQFGYHIIKRIDQKLNDQGELEVHSAHILFQKTDADLENIIWEESGLSGRDIAKAQLSFEQNTQAPLVLLSFNDKGRDLFGELTTDNVGKPIAIFLDGVLISSPVVNEPIKDGQAQITGNFSILEAKELVKNLNLGALPVPIELISQSTVGASLGEESLGQSLLAGIIGFIAAALFMLIFYRLPGLLAVVALAIYAALTLAIFEIIPVTMTLAGVAGFILSIGMAVDANVLIFERTKEELREGKSLNTAIENGFTRAWPSIKDSNISSIITCIILAWFGTSIIKGFAITLGIGILVSMFSAITVTRTFLRIIVNKKLEGKLALFGVKRVNVKE
ncbi:MAG: protein-export membrane protein SecD [Candidatus Komeilibacteria bacterium RIFOXYC1_FULL_37_11]|uniref:Protein translocase subunit SecD n=1 Tax=Candidatus Komeilibacteria bacterium RIFOXYC1_FULL_37_11 TaxID=1798555 RepID=A0A1G2BZM9_9BACT|nr:MAG: protein-export membrane protein SecD [Candidatus Komeilibacteria bacterium RIFOXYC1_FULL_37_11]OGY95534.1 MAG: protein-export membrane protein SecD [Candidatus Komeilibacteria bacterium RIFOXYD1_FULL_37_29]